MTVDLTRFIFNSNNLDEGFTQSEISTLSNCGMKWNLGYNIGLRLKGGFSWALAVGSSVHDCIEQMLVSRSPNFVLQPFQYPPGTLLTPAEQDKEYYWRCVVQAMMEAFAIYYKDDWNREYDVKDIEMELDIKWQGLRLRGKIDWKMMYADLSKYIVDWKTCSRLDKGMTEEWDFRFQFMFYPWAAKQMGMDINGFMPCAIKKPELRVKIGESVETFAARVRFDMITDPDKYFYRELLPLTDGAMKHFEDVVLAPKVARLQILADPNPSLQNIQRAIALDMNTDHCQRYGAPCEFIRLCRHGWDDYGFEYETKHQKHTELTEE